MSTIALDVANTGGGTIVFCAQGGTTCSTLTAQQCSASPNNVSIDQGKTKRLNVIPTNNRLCLTIFAATAAPTDSPLTSAILRTTSAIAGFFLQWDGTNITLTDSFCNTRPTTTVDKAAFFTTIVVNTLTDASIFICSRPNVDCSAWTFDCNPCGEEGVLVAPNSIQFCTLATDVSGTCCTAMWVDPSNGVNLIDPTTASTCTPSSTGRKPNKIISITPSTASPPQNGLQIIVGGTVTAPTFSQTVLYSCDPIPPEKKDDGDESFFRRFWWLIVIIIVVIIIIILVMVWAANRPPAESQSTLP